VPAPAPAPAHEVAVVAPAHEDDPSPAADPPANAGAKKKKHHDDSDDEPAAKPADEPKKDDAKKDDAKKKSHYTLQLSSFQDKGEAEAFVDSIKGAGYAAYLVEADVDGKGTFWRVRFGSYPSYDDAIDAKSEFEAKVKKVAYVTKL
jgi:cell division septation protein DedD